MELAGTTSRPPSSTTSSPTTASRTGCTAGSRRAGRPRVASRGNDGQITFRDWHTVGVGGVRLRRAGPAQPGHRLRRQGAEATTAAPGRCRTWRRKPPAARRTASSAPPRSCSRRWTRRRSTSAATCCSRRPTGGTAGRSISPDLSRPAPEVPESVGVYRTPAMARRPRRGVIYTVAPSYAGGGHHLGGHRRRADPRHPRRREDLGDVTPPALAAWSKVAQLDGRALRPTTPPTRPSTASAWTTRSRTSTARTTAGRRGRRIVRGLPTTPGERRPRGPGAEGACCSPAPSGRCTCRSTTATTGSRCG